ncbi:hypothetical protein B484DRAFT_471447 [Ochromonadaceae sp. CCMP2298]|nr:hypothetical protein B484DRAFT_471447 [Ochromonadaceae sp. CCMP2298]
MSSIDIDDAMDVSGQIGTQPAVDGEHAGGVAEDREQGTSRSSGRSCRNPGPCCVLTETEIFKVRTERRRGNFPCTVPFTQKEVCIYRHRCTLKEYLLKSRELNMMVDELGHALRALRNFQFTSGLVNATRIRTPLIQMSSSRLASNAILQQGVAIQADRQLDAITYVLRREKAMFDKLESEAVNVPGAEPGRKRTGCAKHGLHCSKHQHREDEPQHREDVVMEDTEAM